MVAFSDALPRLAVHAWQHTQDTVAHFFVMHTSLALGPCLFSPVLPPARFVVPGCIVCTQQPLEVQLSVQLVTCLLRVSRYSLGTSHGSANTLTTHVFETAHIGQKLNAPLEQHAG